MAGTMRRALLAGAVLAGLSACQETRSRPGPLASATGVPIALEIGGGAPQTVRTAFASELSAAAAARQVDVTGAGSTARYRVRGYLATETTAEGDAALAFVWDVFDDQNRLARRLTGSSPLGTASPDPWAGLDKAALARLAERSMDEIIGFLSADAATAGNPPPT
jgi:hypothetical protein